MSRSVRARSGVGVLAVVLGLAVTGCGGDDSDAPAAKGSASATAAPSPSSYLAVPDGVTLTDQGADLAVGAPATVAWKPRQDTVGVLDVTVTQLQRTTLKRSFVGWKIPAETEKANPYFVRATVTNVGSTDLGGQVVPLYLVAADGSLVEATTFASAFKPCRDGVFPAAFGPGATAQVCLVYFAPDKGELSGVSFRPTQEFDPITWTGTVEKVASTKKKTPS